MERSFDLPDRSGTTNDSSINGDHGEHSWIGRDASETIFGNRKKDLASPSESHAEVAVADSTQRSPTTQLAECLKAIRFFLQVLESPVPTIDGNVLTDHDRFQLHYLITQKILTARDEIDQKTQNAKYLLANRQYKTAEDEFESAIRLADKLPIEEIKRIHRLLVKDQALEAMNTGDPILPDGILRSTYLNFKATEIDGDSNPLTGIVDLPVRIREELAFMQLGLKCEETENTDQGSRNVMKMATKTVEGNEVLALGQSELFNPNKAAKVFAGIKTKLKETRGVDLEKKPVGYKELTFLAQCIDENQPEAKAMLHNALSDISAAGIGSLLLAGAVTILSRGRLAEEAIGIVGKTAATRVIPKAIAVAGATGTRAAMHNYLTGETESFGTSFAHGAGAVASVFAASIVRDGLANYLTKDVTTASIVNRLAKENITTVNQLERHFMTKGMMSEARALSAFRGQELSRVSLPQLYDAGLSGAKGVNILKGVIGKYADDIGAATRLREQGVHTVDHLRMALQKGIRDLQPLANTTKMAKDGMKITEALTMGGEELSTAAQVASRLEAQGVRTVGQLREMLVKANTKSVFKGIPRFDEISGSTNLYDAAKEATNLFGAKNSAARKVIETLVPQIEKPTGSRVGQAIRSQILDRMALGAIDVENGSARALAWKLGQAGYGGALAGSFIYNSTARTADNMKVANENTDTNPTPFEAFLAANYRDPLDNVFTEALWAAPFLRPGPIVTRMVTRDGGNWLKQLSGAINPLDPKAWERLHAVAAKDGMSGLKGLTTMGSMHSIDAVAGAWNARSTIAERQRLQSVTK